jgi:hypothetical protein
MTQARQLLVSNMTIYVATIAAVAGNENVAFEGIAVTLQM